MPSGTRQMVEVMIGQASNLDDYFEPSIGMVGSLAQGSRGYRLIVIFPWTLLQITNRMKF